MRFKLFDFNWRVYFAYYPDFACSAEREVRRAWWFLWHGARHRFGHGSRCYRLLGLTLHGRAVERSGVMERTAKP